MLKKFAIYLVSALSLMPLVACNSDKDKEEVAESKNLAGDGAIVKAFALGRNDKLLEHLDSVNFAIDQVNARIFNADSLPFGTSIDKLTVNINYGDCSKVELQFTNKNGAQTVNYLTHATDSIDFSRGPVTLRVVSADGTRSRSYELKVNVHKSRPEQFVWSKVANTNKPTTLATITNQRVVLCDDVIYALATDGSMYTLGKCKISENKTWDVTTLSLSFTPDVRSLNVAGNTFYILDTDNNLYSSNDGVQWTATGTKMSHIYGSHLTKLLGAIKEGGKYYTVTYPDGKRAAASAEMPVSGTSDAITFSSKWSTSPQTLIRGGRTSTGELTGAMFGFDGKSWARISRAAATPSGTDSPILIPYYVTRTDSATWRVTEHSALLSAGGRASDGLNDQTMYVSYDMGISWAVAPTALQFPTAIIPTNNADALIVDVNYPKSRVTRPITEWECPTIYLFGGQTDAGTTVTDIWQGYINQLTYKPIY